MNITSRSPFVTTAGGRILIVSNDANRLPSLQAILGEKGHEPIAATVLDLSKGYLPPSAPDLVILDVSAERLRIFEICRTLKRAYSGETVPTIFLTDPDGSEDLVLELASFGIDCLPRSAGRVDLLARVQLLLVHRQKMARLAESDRAKNMLLCMAAHDLRNPLVSIRALTNVLRGGTQGPLTLEQSDLLETVYDASQSMLNLVNELLDVSVCEAGEMRISPGPVSLAALTAGAVKLNNARAAEKGSFIVWQPGLLPAELALDKSRVLQVLNNLLDNAVKFSPPGSMIVVQTELEADRCSILVRDQGPGIPDEEHERLFKAFSRTSVLPTGGEPSTGLGLSICRRIMQAHGGSIEAANAPEGGAEFRISFPLPA